MDTLSFIADILGIASFLLSAILWFNLDRFKQEIDKQRINYVISQKSILANLKALRENIIKDDLLSLTTISLLREELFAMQNDLKHVLKKKGMEYASSTISMLDCDIKDINKNHLQKNLDYLIARFRSKEV